MIVKKPNGVFIIPESWGYRAVKINDGEPVDASHGMATLPSAIADATKMLTGEIVRGVEQHEQESFAKLADNQAVIEFIDSPFYSLNFSGIKVKELERALAEALAYRLSVWDIMPALRGESTEFTEMLVKFGISVFLEIAPPHLTVKIKSSEG